MELSLIHWHIELSSVCTLKCPRCPRLEVPESLLNRQLSLRFFQEQIGKSTISEIKKITFCGNDGDPIYCNDLIEIIEWIKQINPTLNIVLITNGSYKKKEWWERLGAILTKYDEIHWSLDGWDQESNEQYRINSNWNSIIDGIEAFTRVNTSTYIIWALIAFKFNEHRINDIKKLAKTYNFDSFQTTLSTKFGIKYPDAYGIDDALEPSNDLIPKGHRFTRSVDELSSKFRFSETIKELYKERIKTIKQPRLCLIGNKGVFLNSHGEFYPCCWVANRYSHNQQWIDIAQARFNLHKTKFIEVKKDLFWDNEFLKFDNLECNTKCNGTMSNTNNLLEW
jgi:MoaA/NifB/PqqE/SkfB family radical SAM enzyme